jgi:ketosteroid isomerase-like protein
MRLIVLLLSSLLLVACSHPTDADAVREAIEACAAAAKAHDAGGLLSHVAEDFIGNDELDRAQLAQQLRAQLLLAKAVEARVGRAQVEVQGDRATARFEVQVTDSSGRWIADRAAVLTFETGWRREDGEWRCYNAKWSSDAR